MKLFHLIVGEKCHQKSGNSHASTSASAQQEAGSVLQVSEISLPSASMFSKKSSKWPPCSADPLIKLDFALLTQRKS